MESLGTILEGEWNNTFNGLYSCNEESDFMVQLLGNSSSFPNRAVTSLAGVLGESSNCYSSDNNTPGYFNCVQFPIVFGDEDFYQNDSHQFLALYDNNNNNNNNNFMSIDFCVGDEEKNMGMLNESFVNRDISSSSIEESAREANSNSKKRSRIVEVENKRNLKGKKNKKALCRKSNNNDEENNVVANKPSSSSCDSENESNEGVSSSLVLNSNGKSRAVRGSASDPQSLYARKRRERINERLRILQSLVPNGTKVDISTMLEEAVQYVKFLQLQIKLLSSDDMWMYAPLAYNGMDIGLGMNVNAPNS